ncbi:MAG: hypothetical protein WCR54_02635 [Clostridia bacterium]
MKKLKSKKYDNMQNLDVVLNSQAKRIEELKKENAILKNALDNYQKKEQEIASTLNIAKKQADNLVGDAKVKYALECERLKVFSKKWTSLINKSPEKLLESIKKTDETLKTCQIEIEDMLINNFGKDMESYLYERNRLDRSPQLDYTEIVTEEEQKDNSIDKLPFDELQELLNQL